MPIVAKATPVQSKGRNEMVEEGVQVSPLPLEVERVVVMEEVKQLGEQLERVVTFAADVSMQEDEEAKEGFPAPLVEEEPLSEPQLEAMPLPSNLPKPKARAKAKTVSRSRAKRTKRGQKKAEVVESSPAESGDGENEGSPEKPEAMASFECSACHERFDKKQHLSSHTKNDCKGAASEASDAEMQEPVQRESLVYLAAKERNSPEKHSPQLLTVQRVQTR